MCDQRHVPAVNMRENLLSSTIGWQILNIYIYSVGGTREKHEERGWEYCVDGWPDFNMCTAWHNMKLHFSLPPLTFQLELMQTVRWDFLFSKESIGQMAVLL